MIRLIQRRLIIPRGDTGTFTVPVIATKNTGDVAVFSIIDNMTAKKVFEKIVQVSGDTMTIEFSHNETVNLPVGKYVWDIKFYQDPKFADGALINGVEVDSYYAAFTMPICEIRQTGDNLLMADDAPGTELSASQLDILNATVNETNAAKNTAVESASTASAAASTATENAATAVASAEEATAALNELKEILPSLAEVATSGSYEDLEDKPFIPSRVSDLTDDSGHYTKPANGIPASDLEETYLTEHQDISGKANIADLAAVATSGSYTDLEDKPYIPVKTSDLTNDSNYAIDSNYVHTDNNYTTTEKEKLSGIAAGAEVNVNADWNASSGDAQILNKPINVSAFTNDAGYLTTETDPTVPAWAKAAQKPSYTAAEVGAPTVQEMNSAISTAIGNVNSFDMAVVQVLPIENISTHTIYLVPKTGETNDVYDEYIYINNAWEMIGNTQIDLSNYVQKTDYATNSKAGIIKVGSGLYSQGKAIHINAAPERIIKMGTVDTAPIVTSNQHVSAFYGMAKAAGDSSQSSSSNAVGQYTDAAKEAIQSMLGVSQMLAPVNPNMTAAQAYGVGEVFAANGKLYKATAAIAQDAAIIPDTNCEETTMAESGGKIRDVQVGDFSVITDGVAKINIGGGLRLGNNATHAIMINEANAGMIRNKSADCVVTPAVQHIAVFYGLASLAGDTTQASIAGNVGTYTDEAKTAIKQMLGVQDGLKVVRLI